ncbi:hypothetical protein PTE01_22600 [Pseudoalteromonas tetraodonis GFC]|uniref:Uncharacterized protein n=1 Tax=Pseudoalteromonas tetraodonis GFC TaxID=1315271 RepID=A0AA37S4R7_9GAMM|nr:hypothetical protein PTE01_22600 [Pseudoalteromonas tetraodonis GFC]GLQ04432.1 hypothetical protein GCM10007914_33130 [Pseudoalteromonas tetraodonis GFC]
MLSFLFIVLSIHKIVLSRSLGTKKAQKWAFLNTTRFGYRALVLSNILSAEAATKPV